MNEIEGEAKPSGEKKRSGKRGRKKKGEALKEEDVVMIKDEDGNVVAAD